MTEHSSPTRVLICEDERDLARLIAAVLQDEGYETRVHPNGDCLSVLQEFDPHVILCDYMLPVHDGQEVLKRLRASSMKRAPVIMISAMQTADIGWREWGADDFLPKPFDIERLIAVVERAASGDAKRWSQGATIGRVDEQAS